MISESRELSHKEVLRRRLVLGASLISALFIGGTSYSIFFAPRDRTPIRLTTDQALQIEGHNIWQYRPDTLLIQDAEASMRVSYGELRTQRLIDKIGDDCGLSDPLPPQGANDFVYLTIRTSTLNCADLLRNS